MAIDGQYKSAIEDIGAVCSKDVIAKPSTETRIISIEYEGDLAASETLSAISGSATVAPTGGSHLSIDASAVSGTEAQLTVSGGFAGKSFTAVASNDTLTSAAHGFSDGDTVHLIPDGTDNLPTGVDAETMYYIVTSATNTFQVSEASGGTAVDLTSDGQGVAFVDYVITCSVSTSENQILTCKAICACRD